MTEEERISKFLEGLTKLSKKYHVSIVNRGKEGNGLDPTRSTIYYTVSTQATSSILYPLLCCYDPTEGI